MRLTHLVVILATSLCLLSGKKPQGQDIVFENLMVSDAFLKAAKVQKAVFMDCFTTWCGPCKKMSAQVFTDSTVGVYFNKKFVNLKMDMEKGEGPEIAAKYGVYEYPTLLFLNAKGEVLLRLIGYMPASMFLREAKTVFLPQPVAPSKSIGK